MAEDVNQRLQGMFIGLAVGDALGAPVEFMTPGRFEPVTGMRGYGTHNLPPGYWTDDMSMALCLTDSLLQEHRYDSFDVMNRYQRWAAEGYRSSTGACFDIGNQIRSSLADYEQDPWVPESRKRTTAAGNGSIMRLAPVVMAAVAVGQEAAGAKHLSRMSARETHHSVEAEDATEIFGEVLFHAVTASTKTEVLPTGAISETIERLVHEAGRLSAEEVEPHGYVLSTLQMAVWAFMTTDSFADGALACVNSGGDSDTVAAVYGQLAGAYYGLEGIPADWREELVQHQELLALADQLGSIPWLKTPRTRFQEDHTGGNDDVDRARLQRQPLKKLARVSVDWEFGPGDVEKLSAGSLATEMEDKWHVYLDEGAVHCQRSWTGHEIYRFDLNHGDSGATVSEFFYETDPSIYAAGDAETEKESLWLLLRSQLGINPGLKDASAPFLLPEEVDGGSPVGRESLPD